MNRIPLTSGCYNLTVSSCGTSSLFQELYVRLMQVMWNRWSLPSCLGGYGLSSTGSGRCGKTKAASVDGGKNCSALGHLDWIWYHKQWMGFGKYVSIYFTFYLWLQRFGYRDPNTWCESIWTPKSGFFRGECQSSKGVIVFFCCFVRFFEATNNKTKEACKDWDIWRARIEILTSDILNWFFRE